MDKKENKKLWGYICLALYDRNKYVYFKILFPMNTYSFMFDLRDKWKKKFNNWYLFFLNYIPSKYFILKKYKISLLFNIIYKLFDLNLSFSM